MLPMTRLVQITTSATCVALLVSALGCGSFDQQVKDAAETRQHVMLLQRDVEELARQHAELSPKIEAAAQYMQRAQEALEYIRLSDPQLGQLLQQPLADVKDALENVNEARDVGEQVSQRLMAVQQRTGLALDSATRTWRGAIELRNRASLLRNLAGLVGLRLPGGGDSSGAASSGTNPWGYIFGTGAGLSLVGGVGYGGYRYYRNRKEQQQSAAAGSSNTNVTVSIPPPQYGMPQTFLAGAARGGVPPPPSPSPYQFGGQATIGAQTPLPQFQAQAGFGATVPIPQPGATVPIPAPQPAPQQQVVATSPVYQPQPAQAPRTPVTTASMDNVTVPPNDSWPGRTG